MVGGGVNWWSLPKPPIDLFFHYCHLDASFGIITPWNRTFPSFLDKSPDHPKMGSPMFTLPIACLLMMVPGQAVKVDENTDPEVLLRKADQVVVGAEEGEIKALIPIIKIAMENTADSNLKRKLQGSVWTLEKHQKALSERKIIQENTSKNRDMEIRFLSESVDRSFYSGKNGFLARRNEIEKFLMDSTSKAQVDQTCSFKFGKILADMDRLVQLNKDPVKRGETEKLFAFAAGDDLPEELYPASLGETPLVKKNNQMQREASRLFGPSSFIRLRLLQSNFAMLANECFRGQMPDVDLQAEMDREFAPYLHSEWAKNQDFKEKNYHLKVWVCLSPKGKNYEKLARVIKELEAINPEYGHQESDQFLEIFSYRLLMLSQQGRHKECIQEFEKVHSYRFTQAQIAQKINLVDIHQSAAQSYAALGKKELALIQQELAFNNSLENPLSKIHLVHFRKSVAKDLRDMYAQNNRIKDARNLEERCQLLGLGFEPLPKQPGE